MDYKTKKNKQVGIRVSEGMEKKLKEKSAVYGTAPATIGYTLIEAFLEQMDAQYVGQIIWPPKFRTTLDVDISDELLRRTAPVAQKYGMTPGGLAAYLLEQFIMAVETHGKGVIYPPEFKTWTEQMKTEETTCPKVGGPQHLQGGGENENTKKKAG